MRTVKICLTLLNPPEVKCLFPIKRTVSTPLMCQSYKLQAAPAINFLNIWTSTLTRPLFCYVSPSLYSACLQNVQMAVVRLENKSVETVFLHGLLFAFVLNYLLTVNTYLWYFKQSPIIREIKLALLID